MAEDKQEQPVPSLAQPPRETGNTPDRLFRLEQQLGMFGQRIQHLEEENAHLKQTIREESMRILGMAFASIGEQMIIGATAGHKFQAVECDDAHPINDETFYVRRISPEELRVHVMRKDVQSGKEVTVDVEVSKLPAGMAKAITEFLAKVPADVPSLAFNVYREA